MRCSAHQCRMIIVLTVLWILFDVLLIAYLLDRNTTSSTSDSQPARGSRHYYSQLAVEKLDSLDEIELNKLLSETSFVRNGPGSNGEAVVIDPKYRKTMKRMFELNKFNLMASDLISVNRSLPDYRHMRCRAAESKYKSYNFESVSIIIVFHNEAWTTLLRTIHSVINRSPHTLLREIILIDDYSDRSYLKKPLDAYVKRIIPVNVFAVHLPKRSGLVAARLVGAKMAEGKIMIFLDAHVEVTNGWLEPLLYEVQEDGKRILAPLIDVISDETFEYIAASDSSAGGFSWEMNFEWNTMTLHEMERRDHDPSAPIRTPTIAGGLFAINRQFFYDIGAYDDGMQVWGGENLEISFRVWMCGGMLEIHPCSRVGHVFRKESPYTFPGGTVNVIHHNAVRTVEVWMDEFKQFFYKSVPSANSVDAGDITERKALRKNLQCKSFRWYLENVYMDSSIPVTYSSIGMVYLASTDLCLDTMGKKKPRVQPCHRLGGNQVWSLTGSGQLRTSKYCLNVNELSLILAKCSRDSIDQIFSYDAKRNWLMHQYSKKCLTDDSGNLRLMTCNSALSAQQWRLEGYMYNGDPHQ